MARDLCEISGTYQNLAFSNTEGTWMIAFLEDGTKVVGCANPADFIRGCEYKFSGKWEAKPGFGRQFSFRTWAAKSPVTQDAVESYLKRNLYGTACGIGERKGAELVRRIGPAQALQVMKTDPEKVAEIARVTLEQAKRAAQTLIDIEKFEHTRVELTQLLDRRGFSGTCIDKLIEDFGVLACEKIRRDPFTMLVRKYHSAGFLRCDQLYRDLGLPENRLKRQTICIWHLIRETSGSVWVEAQQLVADLKRLISSPVNPSKAIKLGVRAKILSRRRDEKNTLWIAESSDAIDEAGISKLLRNLRDGKDPIDGESEGSSEDSGRVECFAVHGGRGNR